MPRRELWLCLLLPAGCTWPAAHVEPWTPAEVAPLAREAGPPDPVRRDPAPRAEAADEQAAPDPAPAKPERSGAERSPGLREDVDYESYDAGYESYEGGLESWAQPEPAPFELDVAVEVQTTDELEEQPSVATVWRESTASPLDSEARSFDHVSVVPAIASQDEPSSLPTNLYLRDPGWGSATFGASRW